MKYFDQTGRCVPSKNMRTFGEKPSYYYTIKQPEIDYSLILERGKRHNDVPDHVSLESFQEKAELLLDVIEDDPNYANLLKGVHVPFLYKRSVEGIDLGMDLEDVLLPHLQESFAQKCPDSHFKATLQGDPKLNGSISVDPNSRYQKLIESSEKGATVGWYFPQALQEYDVKSQRLQLNELPDLIGGEVCLSGGIDVCSALIGVPDLLISSEDYAPILCLSAYVHKDPRLTLLIKSYGPHMEFWCMTQMLTKGVTQASEQWAGGISIFQAL